MTDPAPPPMTPAPRAKANWLVVVASLGGVVMLVFGYIAYLIFFGGSRPATAGNDVTISRCTTSQFGAHRAVLRITNSTSRTRNYLVTVAFMDGNRQLGTGLASVFDLAPGQYASPDAVDAAEATGEFTCVITKVSSY